MAYFGNTIPEAANAALRNEQYNRSAQNEIIAKQNEEAWRAKQLADQEALAQWNAFQQAQQAGIRNYFTGQQMRQSSDLANQQLGLQQSALDLENNKLAEQTRKEAEQKAMIGRLPDIYARPWLESVQRHEKAVEDYNKLFEQHQGIVADLTKFTTTDPKGNLVLDPTKFAGWAPAQITPFKSTLDARKAQLDEIKKRMADQTKLLQTLEQERMKWDTLASNQGITYIRNPDGTIMAINARVGGEPVPVLKDYFKGKVASPAPAAARSMPGRSSYFVPGSDFNPEELPTDNQLGVPVNIAAPAATVTATAKPSFLGQMNRLMIGGEWPAYGPADWREGMTEKFLKGSTPTNRVYDLNTGKEVTASTYFPRATVNPNQVWDTEAQARQAGFGSGSIIYLNLNGKPTKVRLTD